MLYTIFQAVIILGLVCVIALIINKVEDSKKDFMSFRETLALTELPIVTFFQGEHKLNFVLDTGANNSVLDMNAAMPLEVEPTDKVSEYVGVGGKKQMAPMMNINLTYKDKQYTDCFQVMDMSHVFSKIKETTGATVHGMIGNAFMQKYKYVLDFKEMIAYARK